MQQLGNKYFARRPLRHPDPWGQMVESLLFQNMVMFHIKLKGITKCSNVVANIELTKTSAKFELATPNCLEEDAFTRKYFISLLT